MVKRHGMFMALVALVLLTPLLSSVVPPAHAASTPTRTYSITGLGTLGGSFTRAAAINNAGQVVGISETRELDPDTKRPIAHAFLWQRGTMIDLGRPPEFDGSEAVDINNAGQVAYNAYDEDFETAAVWKNGEFTSLGPWIGATAINDAGAVVGWDDDEEGSYPYIWQKGKKTYLSPPPTYGMPQDVNKHKQVVGVIEGDMAVLWQQGGATELGALGGNASIAYAINDHGQIVGAARTRVGHPHAFLWQNGRMTDLGTLGGARSRAHGINIHGTIVGAALTPNGAVRAVVWRAGRISDLNTVLPKNSGWILERATDINDRGEIVGNGIFNGKQRAFLLTPRTTFEAEACSVSSPFTVKNGLVAQSVHTPDPARAGTVRCRFTVPIGSTYSVKMVVHAPSLGANSVFVNVDAQPTSSAMIWDIPVSAKLVERTVSWRGAGTPEHNQYVPKVFQLKAGTHDLIIRGREARTAIDRIMIVPY